MKSAGPHGRDQMVATAACSTQPRRPSARSTCAHPSRVPRRRTTVPGFAWKCAVPLADGSKRTVASSCATTTAHAGRSTVASRQAADGSTTTSARAATAARERAPGATAFTPIPNILLADEFEPAAHFDVKKPKHLCTPANKNNEGVLDAVTHLKSYQIKAVTGSPRFLKRPGNKMANQLAPHPVLFLDAIKPDLLLVPTAKSLSSPPGQPGPNTVNHYKCYKARVTSGTPPFPKGVQVTVADQFRTTAGTFDVKKPKHLCTPVSKNGEPVPNSDAYLVCYLAKPAKGVPKHVPVTPVYVNNQFGPETLKTVKEDELCIPSVKIP